MSLKAVSRILRVVSLSHDPTCERDACAVGARGARAARAAAGRGRGGGGRPGARGTAPSALHSFFSNFFVLPYFRARTVNFF